MLHHISVAVNQPMQVGEVLAEVMGGRAFPFPSHPGSCIILAGDDYGTAIELYPSGTELLPGQSEVLFSQLPDASTFTAVHAAISVSISQEQIEQIGRREGWNTRLCDRGPFQVIEFWVENKLMLELLPPALTATYLEFVKPENWDAFMEMAKSLDLAGRHRAEPELVSV